MASAKESWRIEGEYFESCNCVVLCPCLLSNATAQPTDGHCDVVLAYHVRSGNYGKIDLAGLNVVQAITTPGPMAQGDGTLALYVDSRANDLQRPALEAIFIGAAGGPPSLFAPMIATVMPVKSAPITFTSDGKKWSVSIPGVTDVTIEGIAGAGKETVWLDNVGHPASRRLAAARSSSSSYKDHALSFENSGRNGHFSPISWAVA
jgi:hypothetical protein